MLTHVDGLQPQTGALAPSLVLRREIDHGSWTELQATFPHSATASTHYLKLNPFLGKERSACLNLQAFEVPERLASLHREMLAANILIPETTLLQNSRSSGGMQISTISGIDSTPLFAEDGRMIGRFFEDSDAKYCVLGDIRPTYLQGARSAQTTEVLDAIQRALMNAGMDFGHVVRAWFYNDDILDWYDEFNRARTSFFRRHEISRMPASTGIGASNACGAALVARAIAVQRKTSKVTIRRVDSPLQSEASTYGSAFSRAMEVSDQSVRTLYISGTASILPNGQTVHVGNAARQIEKSMEVVEAILVQNGMNLSDTTRAIAYFRHREDIPLWEQYCRARQLPQLPIILTECDICRDNLLFEIELDAARDSAI